MLPRYRPSLGIFNTRVYYSTRVLCSSRASSVVFPSRLLTHKLFSQLAAASRALSRLYPTSTHYTSRSFRTISTMATATQIHLSPSTDSGVYSSNVTEEGARAASEVLQEDMQIHHVFFNERGFHSMHLPLCLSDKCYLTD